METVKESKLNPHEIFKDSESIHLNIFMCTGILDIPTSMKVNREITVVAIMHEHVINCDPVTPTFLPKNPDTMEPKRGRISMLKYIT